MPPLNNDKQHSIKTKIMITTVKKANKDIKRNYPYMGFSYGMLVYFTDVDAGVIINDEEDDAQYPIGSYKEDWDEEDFEVFEGEITLKNS